MMARGFEAAGEHLNPTDASHGFADPAGPHAGDLVNIVVMPDGSAKYGTVNGRVNLSERKNGLSDEDGSALVITERPDDYSTDPDGNSGAVIASGVVEGSTGFLDLGSGLPVLIAVLSIAGVVPWGLLVVRRFRGR